MASLLRPEQVTQLRALFDAVDEKKTGRIDGSVDGFLACVPRSSGGGIWVQSKARMWCAMCVWCTLLFTVYLCGCVLLPF